MKITKEDIMEDYNGNQLAFIDGVFGHRVKHLGEKGCVEHFLYEGELENLISVIKKDNPEDYVAYNFIQAFLKYYANRQGILFTPEYVSIPKWIIYDTSHDWCLDIMFAIEENIGLDEFDISDCIPEFAECKIYLTKIDEAV